MHEYFVTLDINQIIKMLGSIEQLLGIVVNVFSRHWRAHHNIDAIVSVELHHSSHFASTVVVIDFIHSVKNSIHSSNILTGINAKTQLYLTSSVALPKHARNMRGVI